jgi:hypothetical protein
MNAIKFPALANFGIALTVASLVSALVHYGLPLADSGSLFGTFVVLPLAATGLVWIGRWGHVHGGRRIPTPVAATEGVLVVILVLLALGRQHLGLIPGGSNLDRLIAAGFALLLAHRIAWILAALRPSLGSIMPARPPWPFFALPLIAYLSILPWASSHHSPAGDEPHYLLLTHSLAYDFDTDLRNNYEQGDSLQFVDRRLARQPGDPTGESGQLYSRHNILLPLFLAPAYRLLGTPAVLALMATLTAAVCWLTLCLSHWYVRDRPGEALLAYSILAFTAPLLLFSYQVWVEVPAALLTLVALVHSHRLGQSDVSQRRVWLGLTLPLLLLPLLKLRFLLIAAPLAFLAVWRGGRSMRRVLVPVLFMVAGVGLGILVFNQSVFESPLKYHQINSLLSQVGSLTSYFEGFAGMAFDCAFGLFSSGPLWMLLLPATILVTSKRSRLLIDFVVVFSLYLLLLLPRVEWFGGWSPPFRYGIVMLPFLALWLIPLLASRRRLMASALLTGLGALTVALTILWLVEPGWTYNLAHGRSHLLDLLGIRLDADVARFFPSSTRPRAATWLWPPLALVTVSLLWWRPKRVGRHPAALGVTMLLLCLSLLLWSARHQATRVVEFEDPWIEKSSGQVYPELWRVYRPRYRGGWILPEGATVIMPLVPGGGRLTLRVDLRSHSVSAPNSILELGDSSGEVRAEQPVTGSGQWQTAVFEDLEWPAESRLTLTLQGDGDRGQAVAILDCAFLKWGRHPNRVEKVTP